MHSLPANGGNEEKDRIQQSSVVVVEFDNHEIFVKIGLPRAESCFSAQTARLPDSYLTPVPAVLQSVRSVAILLDWLCMSLMKPHQNVTIGSEDCRSGHVQA